MESQVKRETMRACLSCPLCDRILRDATTISECLHTFCRKCIYEKITEDEIECCPVCNISLGGNPLEKLRPDHNLQDLRAKFFPLKRRKVKGPEMVSLPAKKKVRSISSLIVNTPKVSAQSGTTGRSKAVTRKELRGKGSLAERIVKEEESSFHEEIVDLFEEFSFRELLVPGHLAQENRELRHSLSAVIETLKSVTAERNSADVLLGEMKSLLAARDRELEAKEKEL
ncbi:unnamed protein product [Thlaspi arvense]|uniref:RING-type domain-containing protein n=1 Tax=Thlaspi arvense TaxID=13288 RepID=A0AAU9RDE8_THLAR|nr:unnamed protein product [Thlaspi arvense]